MRNQRPHFALASSCASDNRSLACWRFAPIVIGVPATSKRAARVRYQSLLERVLRREYPGFHLEQFSRNPDLEHSLSPLYTRGLLRTGQTAFAVLGVSAEETQSCGRCRLTFGILWMDYQRRQLAGRAQWKD
jgi:hypothetical protein